MTDEPTTSGDITGAGLHPSAKAKRVANSKSFTDPSFAEFAGFHEGYVRHYIALADTKAAIVLGLASTFIAFLFSKAAFQFLLFNPTCAWQSCVAWICVALLIASGGFSAWVIAPRLKTTGEGLVFFGSVQAHSDSKSYANAVRSAGVDLLIEARLRHCYDVSSVCWRKYYNLRLAIWLSVAGLLASLPLLGSI